MRDQRAWQEAVPVCTPVGGIDQIRFVQTRRVRTVRIQMRQGRANGKVRLIHRVLAVGMNGRCAQRLLYLRR